MKEIPTASVAEESPDFLEQAPELRSSIISRRMAVRWVWGQIRLRIFVQATRLFRNPVRALAAMKELRAKKKQYFGSETLNKLAYVSGRFYWTLEAPGWPGKSFDGMIRTEMKRSLDNSDASATLRIAFLSVTKKCPLACEHCYDWHNLNQRECLEEEDLAGIVSLLQSKGVSQVFLSGGEPLVRFAAVISLLNAAQKGTDFWLLTSGFHLDAEKASALKQAGLTGVCISLDHYEAEHHNAFRGLKNAYELALRAVQHAKDAGLVVALSICPTKVFTTEENMMQYARLARRLGVAFIQVLEPRAVGRYDGADIALSNEQIKILETFHWKLNFDAGYRDWPIVSFHGYRQRRVGCGGAGDRFLYIDSNGDIHACPFCQSSSGNVLTDDWSASVKALQKNGCMSFDETKL